MSGVREARRQVRFTRIFEATMEIFAAQGIAAIRLSDIASRVGMSPGHLYHYFDSKSDLLVRTLRWEEDRFYEEFERNTKHLTSPTDRIAALVEEWAPTGRTDVTWLLWLEVSSLSRNDPQVAESFAPIDARSRKTWAALVREGQKDGVFRTDVDPTAFALRFSALTEGLAIRLISGLPGASPKVIRSICLAELERTLGCSLGRGKPVSAVKG